MVTLIPPSPSLSNLSAKAIVLLSCLMLHGGASSAQEMSWLTDFVFYGDNTEFFNPFRTGETLLGGQFQTAVAFDVSPRIRVLAGGSLDYRSGGDRLRELEPLLSFRYRNSTSTGVVGTLIRRDRHELIDPLAVSTLAFNRPTEQGLQWIEHRLGLDMEMFLNWQALNTTASREIIDYGITMDARPSDHVAILFQLHGVHHGGQLFDAGEPVSNNIALGPGARLSAEFDGLGPSSLTLFYLVSTGDIPEPRAADVESGSGVYVRAVIEPVSWLELSVLQWWGDNFIAVEGDANYGSKTLEPEEYRPDRKYSEIGLKGTKALEEGVSLSGDFRLHHVDGARGKGISSSTWEYSYRITAEVPVDVSIR